MRTITTIFALLTLGISQVYAADTGEHTQGKAVFDKWCGICHAPANPASGGGTETLALLYAGTDIPAELENRTDMSPEFIRETVRWGRLNMPNFRKTEISNNQLDALIAYLTRNNR